MKLAILGSRGIPNRYGGFERFAEQLAVWLVAQGHDVSVYCSDAHPYQEPTFHGVKRIICADGEPRFGTAGQFIYDWNCIQDSRHRGFDVILQLGYTSSSVWGWRLPRRVVIVTNMDGMEWKRSKYSRPVQQFLRWAEAWAVRTSDYLVADSPGIRDYLHQTYGVEAHYIAYGAEPQPTPAPDRLAELGVQPLAYDLLIARAEPENNLEAILEGVSRSQATRPLLVVANKNTDFAQHLIATYRDPRIRFLGGLFDQSLLNVLRHYSQLYYHGHSVGGTNPSLVEALAANALVVAHRNVFNAAIVGPDGYYFDTPDDIARLRDSIDKARDGAPLLANNRRKVEHELHLDTIHRQYAAHLEVCLQQGVRR